MAKIVVHMADTGDHPDNAALNAQRFRPGDIVSIKSDNHVFSGKTLGAHNLVIELPNIAPREIEHLIGRDIDPLPGEEFHQRGRVWTFANINAVGPVFDGFVSDFLALMKIRQRQEVE